MQCHKKTNPPESLDALRLLVKNYIINIGADSRCTNENVIRQTLQGFDCDKLWSTLDRYFRNWYALFENIEDEIITDEELITFINSCGAKDFKVWFRQINALAMAIAKKYAASISRKKFLKPPRISRKKVLKPPTISSTKVLKPATISRKIKPLNSKQMKKNVYINECTLEEIKQMKGIGEKITDLIEKARKKKPFKDIDDFMGRVKGLGKKKMKGITKEAEISFASLAAGFCREKIASEKLKIEIPPEIIIIIREHSYVLKYNSCDTIEQKNAKPEGSEFKSAQKHKTDKPRVRTIRSGVNSGIKYYPKPYKSDRKWKRLK
eukprot:417259_1